MMELEIRRANPEDADRLSAIARAAKATWRYPAEWLSAWDPKLTVSAQYIRSEVVFIAVHGSEMVAFYALERREGHWKLEHLWVEPGWQGQGVGRRLFRHALQQIRAVQPGTVVIDSDPHAAGFYLRMGARQTGSMAAPVSGEPERRTPVFQVDVPSGS